MCQSVVMSQKGSQEAKEIAQHPWLPRVRLQRQVKISAERRGSTMQGCIAEPSSSVHMSQTSATRGGVILRRYGDHRASFTTPERRQKRKDSKYLLTLTEGISHRARSSGIMNRLMSQPHARSLKVRSCQSATKEKTMTVLITKFFDPPKGT